MSIISQLKTTKPEDDDILALDMVMYDLEPEISEAITAGYKWMSVYSVVKAELEKEGKWNEGWTPSKVYNSFRACLRFKRVLAAKKKGEIRNE